MGSGIKIVSAAILVSLAWSVLLHQLLLNDFHVPLTVAVYLSFAVRFVRCLLRVVPHLSLSMFNLLY